VLTGTVLVIILLSTTGEEGWLDAGEDSSLCNGGVGHESVQLLIVTDGEEDVPGVDSVLLVILGGVTSKFKDLVG
jgi:hypothetical protein